MPRQYQSDWFMAPSGNPHWVDAAGRLGNWLGQGATWLGNNMAPGLTPSNPQFIFRNNQSPPAGAALGALAGAGGNPPQQQVPAVQQMPPAGPPQVGQGSGVIGGMPNFLMNLIGTANRATPAQAQNSGGLSLGEVQQMVSQAQQRPMGSPQPPGQQMPAAANLINQATQAQSPINPALAPFGGQAPTLDQWMQSIDQFRPFTTPGLEQYVSNHAANPGSTMPIYAGLANAYPNILGQVTAGEQAATGRMAAMGNLGLGIGDQAQRAAELFNPVGGLLATRAQEANTSANRWQGDLARDLIGHQVQMGANPATAIGQIRSLLNMGGPQPGPATPGAPAAPGGPAAPGTPTPAQAALDQIYMAAVRAPGSGVQLGQGPPNLTGLSPQQRNAIITNIAAQAASQNISPQQLREFLADKFTVQGLLGWENQTISPLQGWFGSGQDSQTQNILQAYLNNARQANVPGIPQRGAYAFPLFNFLPGP